MSNDELLQKVIETSTIGAGGGGLLTVEQSNRFIDYMWDETVLAGQVRTIRMNSNNVEVDKIGVGTRLMRLATEAVDDGVNAGATFTKINLTTEKLRMDFEISSESLEDNLEGEALEDHLVRLFTTQAKNDVEDVAINGDTALTTDPLLKSFDGWRKRLLAGGHVVDWTTAGGGTSDPTVSRGVFNAALKAMPRVYMNSRNRIKFFTGSNLIQDYLFSIQQVSDTFVTPLDMAQAGINQAVRTSGPAGFSTGFAFGQTVQEVPLFDEAQAGDYVGATGDHSEVWLTDPQNLLWGVKRDIKVYREFKPKKDTIEYTIFVRMGVQVEQADAAVVVKNIKLAA